MAYQWDKRKKIHLRLNWAESTTRLDRACEFLLGHRSHAEHRLGNPAGPAHLLAMFLVLVVAAGCGPRPAATGSESSGNWAQRIPHLTPSQLGRPLMAYDQRHHQIVMYGNRTPRGSELGETWTWNGSDWAEADRTGEFISEAMVYDGKLGSVVAFSFAWRDPEYQLWTGSAWSPPQSGGPTPRYGEAVAYDPESGNVVVFGGSDWYSQSPLGDTWTWDGSTWMQQHPSAHPSPRLNATLAYDPVSKKLLLFGGFTSTGVPGNNWSTETWTWVGSTWTLLSPSASPPATSYVAATDPATGAPLLIGRTPIMSPPPSPYGSQPPFQWQQWRWTGTTWQAQIVGVHMDRMPAATAYDQANHNTLALIARGSGELMTTWTLGQP